MYDVIVVFDTTVLLCLLVTVGEEGMHIVFVARI